MSYSIKRFLFLCAPPLGALAVMLEVMWFLWQDVRDGIGLRLHESNIRLLIAVILLSSLMGLLAFWLAFGQTQLLVRAASFLLGVAVLGTPLFVIWVWPRWGTWRLLHIFLAQLVSMVVLKIFAQRCNFALWCFRGDDQASCSTVRRPSQFSLLDTMFWVSGCAVVFAVGRFVNPDDVRADERLILFGYGCGSAIVALAGAWAGLGTAQAAIRLSVVMALAPIGGAVFIVGSHLMPLMFTWWWWASFTGLQAVIIASYMAGLRSCGFRLGVRPEPVESVKAGS